MENSVNKVRLEWRDHGGELSKLSREVFGSDDLADVTLTCRGGAAFHAHKLVLAAASAYFRNFFREVRGKVTQHQVIFLKDVRPAELESLLRFIYMGEVEIASEDVEAVVKISRELGIVGLSEVKIREKEAEGREILKAAKRRPDSILEPQMTKVAKVNSEQFEVHNFPDSEGNVDVEDEAEGEDDNVEDLNEEPGTKNRIDEEEDEDVEEDETQGGDKDDQDPFLLPEKKSKEGQDQDGKRSPTQQRMNGEKEDMKENNLLIGTVARRIEGRNRGYNYIIGDYIYVKDSICVRADESKMLWLKCSTNRSNRPIQCKGRAWVDPETLEVIKLPCLHSCRRDPDRKFQMEMENEMRRLAETTSDSPKDIYDCVCLEYPSMASKLEFRKCKLMIQTRRNYILRKQM